MPHTGEHSIEGQTRARYGDEYWEENKAKILKTANKYGALDIAGEREPLNSRQRRLQRRREERAEDDFVEEEDEPREREEEEQPRRLRDLILGWIIGRWNP